MKRRPVGLLAVLLALIVLAGCALVSSSPWQTAAPTQIVETSTTSVEPTKLIPSPTSTALPPTSTQPILTSTPMPPTPTPTLTAQQQREEALHEASLLFLADTPQKADQIAREINYAHDPNESADNACGPLTVAILKAADYLPEDASEHDLWLLCLRDDIPGCTGMEKLQKQYFPPDQNDYIRVEESVGKYNFKKNPLKPGDWLFLFAKWDYVKYPGFDHMLVVTRVDEAGRAYTVTNLNRGEGFLITEEMLYDPKRPGTGLFYELTNNEIRGPLGMTGTGGFLLVRHK